MVRYFNRDELYGYKHQKNITEYYKKVLEFLDKNIEKKIIIQWKEF